MKGRQAKRAWSRASRSVEMAQQALMSGPDYKAAARHLESARADAALVQRLSPSSTVVGILQRIGEMSVLCQQQLEQPA